jgi:hypothetical protein
MLNSVAEAVNDFVPGLQFSQGLDERTGSGVWNLGFSGSNLHFRCFSFR